MEDEVSDVFPGVDVGGARCPIRTGEGELESGPPGDVMGFKPMELKGSTLPVEPFSNLKQNAFL